MAHRDSICPESRDFNALLAEHNGKMEDFASRFIVINMI